MVENDSGISPFAASIFANQSHLCNHSARIAPHDLLQIDNIGALQHSGTLPAWAHICLAAAPLVVVRRAQFRNGKIPVGIRGFQRNQRVAAFLAKGSVIKVITPEDLVKKLLWKSSIQLGQSPVSSALGKVYAILSRAPFAWGPTGSIGFELASGLPVSHSLSDLDLILRAPTRIPHEAIRSLLSSLEEIGIIIDVQVETPAGAFSLAEYARQSSLVRLRTSGGSLLVRDPWSTESAMDAGEMRGQI